MVLSVLPHHDLGLHRVRDETILMREVVELVHFLGSWLLVAAVDDHGMERDLADPWDAFFIFAHHADGAVFVGVDEEALPAGDVEIGEHVAAREGGDEGFLGIDEGGI